MCIHPFASIGQRSRRGHDRMVVRFTTICAISTYHHYSCEFEIPIMIRGTSVIQLYVIKFVIDWRQVSRFLVQTLQFPLLTDRHFLTEILFGQLVFILNKYEIFT